MDRRTHDDSDSRSIAERNSFLTSLWLRSSFVDKAVEFGSWNQFLDHRDKEKGACGQYLQLLASWGATDRKATRSRPVKCVGETNLSVDGTLQADEDGGVGLQRKDASFCLGLRVLFGVSFPNNCVSIGWTAELSASVGLARLKAQKRVKRYGESFSILLGKAYLDDLRG